MIKDYVLIFLLVSVATFSYSQTADSIIIDTTHNIINDTTLSLSELNFQDSINALNHQNEMFSDSRRVYNYGLELFDDKNFEAAIVSFTSALAIDSSFSQAFFYRGKCYEAMKNTLAITDYEMAFNLDSFNFLPLYSIAKIQANSDINEAINTYNLIISLNNEESKAHYEKGVLLYIQKDFEAAILSFTNSLVFSKDPRTFNDRASCYRVLGKNDLAIKDYITAIALDADLAFIYNNLASTYRVEEESEKALSYYSLAISKDTNYILAYNNRGSLYIDLNNIENALIDINKVISMDSNYAPAHNNKGVIYHKQKKYTEAIACFDKAISLNHQYAKAYLNRGITKQIVRDEDGACNDWDKAKKLGINIANKYLSNDCN